MTGQVGGGGGHIQMIILLRRTANIAIFREISKRTHPRQCDWSARTLMPAKFPLVSIESNSVPSPNAPNVIVPSCVTCPGHPHMLHAFPFH